MELNDLLNVDLKKLSTSEINNLLSLTEGIVPPGDETPFEMYEPASALLEKFHKSNVQIRIVSGGNRSSKTSSAVVDLVSYAVGRFPAKLNLEVKNIAHSCRVVTVDKEHGIDKIIYPKLMKYIPSDMFDSYDKEHHTIYLKNGSFIEMVTYQQRLEQHGGVSRDYVLLDEEPPEDIFTESLMRILDCGGKMVMAYTPVNGESWISEELVDKAKKFYVMKDGEIETQTNEDGLDELEFYQVYSKDNKFIQDWSKFDSIIRLLSPEQILQRTKGDLSFSSGKVFPMFSDKHIIDDFDPPGIGDGEELPYPIFVALDPHPRIPNAISFVTATPSNTLIIFDELFIDGGAKDIAKAIKEKELGKWIVWRRIDPAASAPDMIDRSRNLVTELGKRGLFFSKGSKDLDSGIMAIKSRLADRSLLVCKRCKHTIKELQKLKWSKTRHEKPEDKNDHFIENTRRIILAGARWFNYVDYKAPLGEWRKYS